MKLHKRIPMRFEDQDYEVQVLYDNASICAVPFYRNHPHNSLMKFNPSSPSVFKSFVPNKKIN